MGFAASPLRPASMPPNGRHVSCGTASSHCFPTEGCRSSRLLASAGTPAGRQSPRPSTAKQLRPRHRRWRCGDERTLPADR